MFDINFAPIGVRYGGWVFVFWACSLPLTMPRTQSSQEGADGATTCGIPLISVGLVDMLVYYGFSSLFGASLEVEIRRVQW